MNAHEVKRVPKINLHPGEEVALVDFVWAEAQSLLGQQEDG
jgi:hypothetical protein